MIIERDEARQYKAEMAAARAEADKVVAKGAAAPQVKTTAPVTTPQKSYADFKRDDYEQVPVIEKMLADQKAADAAKAKQLADQARLYRERQFEKSWP